MAAPEPKEPKGDLEAAVIAALRGIHDPEIPVNIYDLGLIYDLAVGDDGQVRVRMTLTAPNCPVAGSLVERVREVLAQLDEVSGVEVELVWDPPWTPERMSLAARLQAGLL